MDLILYGVSLTPFVLGIVMLLQSLGLSEYLAEWLRAILMALLAILVLNQSWLATQFPWFEEGARQTLIVIGVLLTAKGVWPDARAMWLKAATRSGEPGAMGLPISAHNMRRF